MKLFVTSFIFLFFLCNTIYAQWVEQPAPKVNIIDEIQADDNGNIYAKANISGSYYSTDEGANWSMLELNGDNLLKDLSVDGNMVYVLRTIYPDSVYIFNSTNQGATWNQSFAGILPGIRSASANFLVNGSKMILTGNKFYRSTDSGASWDTVTTGLPSIIRPVSSITYLNNVFYIGFEAVDGVYRSEDNGLTWQKTNYQIPNTNVYSLTTAGNMLYAGTYNQYIAMLASGDTTWQTLSSGAKSSTAIYVDQNNIFASGGDFGMLRSTDNGGVWDTLRNGIQAFDGINSIIGSNGKVYAGTTTGFYSSADNGNSWISLNNGFAGENFSAFTITFSGDTLLLASAGSLYRTLDAGMSWQFSASGSMRNVCNTVYLYKNILFASFGDLVYKSTDAGRNWIFSGDGIGPFLTVSAFISDDAAIYAQTQNGLYRSTNLGDNWEAASGSYSFSPTTANAIGNYIFISCQYGVDKGNWLSSDMGNSWTDIGAGLPDASTDPVIKFYTLGGNILAVTYSALVYSTNDHGSTWTELTTNLPSIPRVISGFQYENTLSFATDFGPYFSSDGINWILKDEGLDYPYDVRPVAVHGDMIYGVADVYMFTRPLSEVTAIENDAIDQPVSFNLFQNYPNPFNPSTKIKFSIPKKSSVILKVYDALGSEVTELINDELSPGEYSVDFNAAGLSSGVYYYQIKSGKFIQTKKMILLR